ncbi:Low-Density Lipoprotein Receptor-Related Protein 2 [Manis pentadactyla]|nr:Low-Density Lipoprotein Receptor-Related Protein 2 [Manis pentadactyla]
MSWNVGAHRADQSLNPGKEKVLRWINELGSDAKKAPIMALWEQSFHVTKFPWSQALGWAPGHLEMRQTQLAPPPPVWTSSLPPAPPSSPDQWPQRGDSSQKSAHSSLASGAPEDSEGPQALCSCPSLIKTTSGKALKSPLTEQ